MKTFSDPRGSKQIALNKQETAPKRARLQNLSSASGATTAARRDVHSGIASHKRVREMRADTPARDERSDDFQLKLRRLLDAAHGSVVKDVPTVHTCTSSCCAYTHIQGQGTPATSYPHGVG